MTEIRKINVPELGKLKAFSHATRAGGFIYVSGTLGTKAGSFELVPGGAKAETHQTLANIQAILRGAGADLADVVKVNVFITDMAKFGEMNEAYLEFFPSDPPARITVGCSALALGAFVEIDCVAYKP
jgi:2-iminobutanoate/2-iminopropanoate deaminase